MKELDRRLKVTDNVIRHLIVRVDEDLRIAARRKATRKAETARRRVARGLPRRAHARGADARTWRLAIMATTGTKRRRRNTSWLTCTSADLEAAVAAGARRATRDRAASGGGGGMFRRRRVCKFRSEKIDYIDYKDVKLLMQFVPERGKIQPRRLSGTSAKWQRKLQLALKRARELALIPYVTD